MNIVYLLTQRIVYLFLIMLCGYGMVKAKLIKTTDSKVLSYLLAYIIAPGSVVYAFQIECTDSVKSGLMFAFVLASVSAVSAVLFTKILKKPLKLNPIEEATAFLSNAGGIVLPLVIGVYGSNYAIYALAYIAVGTAFIWTAGKETIAESKSLDIKKIITNMNILAIIAGAVLFCAGIRLPKPLYDLVSSCNDMVGPTCMLITGIIMGGLDLKKTFSNRRLYLITFLRLVVIPFPILILYKLLPISGMVHDGHTIVHIVLIAAMAPVAANVVQLAQIYDKDYNYASALNFSTTFFCVLTMPLMTLLYEVI